MNSTRLQMLFQTIDELATEDLEATYLYILERRVQLTHVALVGRSTEPLVKRNPFSTTPSPDVDYYDTSWEGDS
ncbi:MAG TPA: hypothetical protein PLQ56_14900 [Aggregatilineales bacterium]|nr:hypothetical protein [Anaerolineae bacterium]HUN07897.1 hypothetical protein [Aggregatilineales bacterium]